jgi:hypothetical protein
MRFMRRFLLVALVTLALQPSALALAHSQDCSSPAAQGEAQGIIAQAQARIASIQADRALTKPDGSPYWTPESYPRMDAAEAEANAIIADLQECLANAGPPEPAPRQELIPIETEPGGDPQIPCVLRDQNCTDLQGNPTSAPQGPAPEEQPAPPAANGPSAADCAGIQDAIAQAQRTITAIEQERGRLVGDEANIDARIAQIRAQLAAGQAALGACAAP